MKFTRLAKWLTWRMTIGIMALRDADLAIGGREDPYLLRWYVIPRNRFFNIYLHEMYRSDDDRALHDHPWFWASFILRSYYTERSILAGGRFRDRDYFAGSLRFHGPRYAHRLMMPGHSSRATDRPLTLFITGPRLRDWGFHCERGWRHWRDFTDESGAQVGKGCN